MTTTITFDHLYKEKIVLNSEVKAKEFFQNMKAKVCEDILMKIIPLSTLFPNKFVLERVEIKILESCLKEEKEEYVYDGVFHVVGVRTKDIYDTIRIHIENIVFLKKVNSIEAYLSCMFKLRYLGCLLTFEDVEEYSLVSKKPMENERLERLKNINDILYFEGESYKDKIDRITHSLHKRLHKKPFEVFFSSMGITQSVFYLYDESEHMDYLAHLVDRTRTHEISLRIIDNEILEMYRIAKRTSIPKIRKRSNTLIANES